MGYWWDDPRVYYSPNNGQRNRHGGRERDSTRDERERENKRRARDMRERCVCAREMEEERVSDTYTHVGMRGDDGNGVPSRPSPTRKCLGTEAPDAQSASARLTFHPCDSHTAHPCPRALTKKKNDKGVDQGVQERKRTSSQGDDSREGETSRVKTRGRYISQRGAI